MLQQGSDKYNIGCIRLGIFVVILIFTIATGLFFFFLLFVFVIIGNKKTKFDIAKVLELIGIYDCIYKFFGDSSVRMRKNILKKRKQREKFYEKKILKEKERQNKELKEILERNEKMDKKFIERISKYIPKSKIQKPKNVILPEKFDYSDLKDYALNQKIKESKKLRENREKIKKYLSSNEAFKYNDSSSKLGNDFNKHKSIWDDYESVIDIMNKKK